MREATSCGLHRVNPSGHAFPAAGGRGAVALFGPSRKCPIRDDLPPPASSVEFSHSSSRSFAPTQSPEQGWTKFAYQESRADTSNVWGHPVFLQGHKPELGRRRIAHIQQAQLSVVRPPESECQGWQTRLMLLHQDARAQWLISSPLQTKAASALTKAAFSDTPLRGVQMQVGACLRACFFSLEADCSAAGCFCRFETSRLTTNGSRPTNMRYLCLRGEFQHG